MWHCGYHAHDSEWSAIRCERDRLREHKHAQAEDIMTLGQQVGKLEAENERLRAALGNFADKNHWSDRPGCLQWMGKRHAIEFAQSVLAHEQKEHAK